MKGLYGVTDEWNGERHVVASSLDEAVEIVRRDIEAQLAEAGENLPRSEWPKVTAVRLTANELLGC